jgi:predicted aminopeptidase
MIAARAAAALAAAALLAGCQVGYYAHLLRGQYELMSRRQPIEGLLRDPGTGAELRQRLSRALEARRFATRVLHLPDNDSYTLYADLGRPYAVWNVYAAPELSLAPHEWCHAFAGCLAYRGYYSLERAREEAARLSARGLDTYVAGVPAYSTLGWIDDPVLNTIAGSEDELAGTIFHELAHQRRFVAGDTAFNESFATFVEQEGLRRFLETAPELAAAAQRRQQRRARFLEAVLAARRRLEQVYADDTSAADKRARKAAELERLRAELSALDRATGGAGSAAPVPNNAWLLPFGLYHEWVDAFAELFRASGGWEHFYAAVDELAAMDGAPRRRRLQELRAAAQAAADPG